MALNRASQKKPDEKIVIEETPPLPPLWKHQQDAIDKAYGKDYFGLLFEMGCGKSRTLCNILDDKFDSNKRVLRTIVFTPLMVVENLTREFQKFGRRSAEAVIALSGTLKERQKTLEKFKDHNCIFITNYESLYHGPIVEQLKKWPIEAIVCDEMHRLKDVTSKRTKIMLQLAAYAKYRYGLSGTPILNSEMDLFSQIVFLTNGANEAFGRNFFVFRSRYFYDANIARKGTHSYFPNWIPRPGISEELSKAIEPFTARVLKKDALDLPPLLKKEIYCEMGIEQERAYKQMKDDFIAFLNDKACVAQLALTKALRLQQIVSGFIKVGDEAQSVEVVFKDVPRISALQYVLEEILPNKVIIWATFKKNYEMIAQVCSSLKVKYASLHGDTPDKQTQIDSFQNDPEVKVMIANPAAGGIGINLTAASYMVYYSKSFSLEHELQSEARAHRGGSEIHDKITRIDLITKGTIDELITKMLASKKSIGDAVLDNETILRTLKKL